MWVLEDRNVSKNKFAILARILHSIRMRENSRLFLKLEQMGPSMNKILGDLNITHALGTTQIFDKKVNRILD